MNHRCFVSYESHPATLDFAKRVTNRIKSDEVLGKHLYPWFFPEKVKEEPSPESWKQAVGESLFTVIVANPNYLASKACSEELHTALECEKERRTQFGLANLRTVFGICPEPDKVPSDLKSWLWWFQYETELCEAMRNQLTQIAPRLSNIESFSFQDWPHGLLTDDGDLDLAIICGSTGKEAPLGETDSERARVLQPLAPFLTIDDQMEIQSARPAEYLPFLTSSLERLSRRKKTNLKMPDADRSASVPEVYCDRTAIRFYPSIFAERNIITVGGGDTNLYSRFIHRCYRGRLPVHFTSPEDSKELCVETIDAGKKGPKIKILSTMENKSLFSGLLLILPNPLQPKKFVVWVAGLTVLGTQAGIKILADNPDDLREGPYPYARAFKGDDDGKWRAHSYVFL